MNLRERALQTVFATKTVTIEPWGTVTIRQIPMGHPRMSQFIAEGQTRYGAEEAMKRRVYAYVVLGLLDDDDRPVFKWSDIDQMRQSDYTPFAECAAEIATFTAVDTDELDIDADDSTPSDLEVLGKD